MNELYIYHHLGLGDHLICNGLVRYVINLAEFERYYLFTKTNNYISVCYMFSDIANLEIIKIKDDSEVFPFLSAKNTSINLLQVGFQNMDLSKYKFDECFYKQLSIPFEYRWTLFKTNRNYKKEIELFNKYEIEENNYVFLHDDPSRGYIINRDYIKDKSLKVISPIIGYTDNMIDYSYIMENAKELHFMDSSFRLLFDSLEDKNQETYYHTYVRGVTNENISNSKKYYIIYD